MLAVFILLALITIISALFVVLTGNIAKAAFSLLFTFLGLAGLYILLAADFIAATQVMVYVGGILVLLLFGVMLTRTADKGPTMSVRPMKAFPSLVLATGVFIVLQAVNFLTDWSAPAEGAGLPATTVDGLGRLFLGKYMLPFEVASVLLLIVLIGAMFLARKEENTDAGA